MFTDVEAFSSFAVDDLDRAERFYGATLGLRTERWMEGSLLVLRLAGGRETLVYPKPDFEPASYTVLNFPVDDVEAAVDALAEQGVATERYEGFDQDEKGISRGEGPAIAWFRDPAGNVLAVLEES